VLSTTRGSHGWVFDADAHVTEPPDVWVDRVPRRYADVAPRMVRDPETGVDHWLINGEPVTASVGATATAGFAGEWPDVPRNLDEVVPAAWRAEERLEHMTSTSVWAEVIYPNVGGFGNTAFLRIPDAAARLACVQAYNDWLVEWCAEDLRRLVPVMALPFWDVAASAAEIERCAPLGHRGILFTGEPQRFGLPVFADPSWDPLWRAAEQTGLPVSFHLGSGSMDAGVQDPDYVARRDAGTRRLANSVQGVKLLFGNALHVADIALSGVLPRFPDLRVVSAESGVGWLPFLLETVDFKFHTYGLAQALPQFDEPPSAYVLRQVSFCFFYEEVAAAPGLLEHAPGQLMFETDFPHPQCVTGDAWDALAELTPGRPAEEVQRLAFTNAAALYGFDVDALRPVADRVGPSV
jgi:uncharacterized protein